MAPLTRMPAANGGHAPTELQAGYYAQRASAGLIIGECTEISRKAYGWADTPGLWSAEEVRGWRRVTSALHILSLPARSPWPCKSQFIAQLAHGKFCRSLGRGLVKTHRLRFH
jgi:2,4-dienoyl-CoA reductase-like NADH-dependent reductase (Old Yellow Enzyme family)